MTDATASTAALPVVGRPLRRDAERNRQRILQAAHEVFAEQGLRASLDDVAHRAGVGVGTVYRRFADKEALVEALFEIRVGQIIAIADRAVSMPSGWDGLVHFLCEVSTVQAGDRGLREIALSTGFGKSRVAVLRSRVASVVEQLVTRAQAEGALRPEITGNDIPLLLLMVGEVAQNARGFRPDLGRRYLRLLLDGLRHRPGTTDLGDPVDDDELQQFMRGWGPAPR
jgi:AcrR family transcriptional regulator